MLLCNIILLSKLIIRISFWVDLFRSLNFLLSILLLEELLFKQITVFQYVHSIKNQPIFPGAKTTWTDTLEFTEKGSYAPIPVYRVMDRQGNIIVPDHDPNLSEETIVKMYKNMTLLNVMDKILYESQRQGKNLKLLISFFF